MAEQLYFEDISGGMEIPSLEKAVSTRSLVMYCGAYEDYAEMHHDKDAAQRMGFPGTVVPGLFTSAFLAQMLTDWITPEGGIRRLQASYRRPHFAGETVVCKGRVTATRVEGGEGLVECELWVENAEGETSTTGSALVALPSRASG